MKKILLSFLTVILICSLVSAKDRPERILGSKFTVPLKVKQSEEKKSSSRFSILGVGIIKSYSEIGSSDVKINYTNYYYLDEHGLPVYYIGCAMSCEVEITNKSEKDFEDLIITMVHEYYESGICDRRWCPPYPVEFKKGEQMPGDSAMVWPGVDIKKGETIILPFEYVCPYETCDGLDQTHVIIEDKKDNYILELYNESEAGIFCPPIPE